jgi:GAF domain-containing protein
MLKPSLPTDEAVRLRTLRSLDLLDTADEERFDRLTRLARRLFDVPIALLSLVDADRQWFKSRQGIDINQTLRDVSFCGHAILDDEVFVVQDALLDGRFHDNPLVAGDPHMRFYAGCPLTVDGARIGTLCLIDHQPRGFSEDDRWSLRDLAELAEREIATARMATIDQLTQLSNRQGFEALARYALGVCKRSDARAALMILCLDGLKAIGDHLGHAQGDFVLSAFGPLLKRTLRESDVMARFGDDGFLVLLTNCNRARPDGCQLAFSAGLIDYDPDRHPSIESLLAEAGALMSECKRNRRVA